jgi:glycosyltransferase involved in cell wall biosynthesis
MPSISLITPHYNRPELLAEMVSSVKQQTFVDWELIIVDDQSEDSKWESILANSSDKRVKVTRRHTGHKGPNTCRNIGLELSKGRYIMFLDSDDLLAPWCLSMRLAEFAKRQELDFLVFPVLLFNKHCGDSDTLWNHLEGTDDIERFLGSTPPWCMTSPIWKREKLIEIGGLDPALRYGTDSELHTRALIHGLRYAKITYSLPDTFIRRDSTPRFNSTISEGLMQAQIDRLSAGRLLLTNNNCPPHYFNLFQRQYFSCLEYFIFNAPQPTKWIKLLIADWNLLPVTTKFDISLMRTYGIAGAFFRKHLYLLLRISRRLILWLRGNTHKCQDTGFHSKKLDPLLFSKLKKELLHINENQVLS